VAHVVQFAKDEQVPQPLGQAEHDPDPLSKKPAAQEETQAVPDILLLVSQRVHTEELVQVKQPVLHAAQELVELAKKYGAHPHVPSWART